MVSLILFGQRAMDKFVSTTLIFLVMWTGLAKWPIYPWYKKRQNRKRDVKNNSLLQRNDALDVNNRLANWPSNPHYSNFDSVSRQPYTRRPCAMVLPPSQSISEVSRDKETNLAGR